MADFVNIVWNSVHMQYFISIVKWINTQDEDGIYNGHVCPWVIIAWFVIVYHISILKVFINNTFPKIITFMADYILADNVHIWY